MHPITRRGFIAASAASAALALYGESPAESSPDELTLWYDKPAKQWVDALPIGNGRLGAMVYGGGIDGSPGKETLQINEDTLWSGKPFDGNNRDATKYLADVRRAVLEEKDYQKADKLCQKMQGLFAESYQPLANLHVEFTHKGDIAHYRRELNLDTACSSCSYTVNQVHFERQAWVSAPDQVIALQLKSDAPDQIDCIVSIDGPLQKSVSSPAPGRLLLTGKAASHIAGAGHPGSEKPITYSDEPGNGMYFASLLEVRTRGGTIHTNSDQIKISGATSVTVLVTAATGYRGYQLLPDTSIDQIVSKARAQLDLAVSKDIDELHAAQVKDHQRLFRRMSLNLGSSGVHSQKPTDQRVKEVGNSLDPSLFALYFQYGRPLAAR